MRWALLLSIAILSGCKTAELAVMHPASGIQIIARLQGEEPNAFGMSSHVKRLPPLPKIPTVPTAS